MSLTPVSRLPLPEGSSFYQLRTSFHRLSLKISSIVKKIFNALLNCGKNHVEQVPADKFPKTPILKADRDVMADATITKASLEKAYKDKKLNLPSLLRKGKVLLIIVDPQNGFNAPVQRKGKVIETIGKAGGLPLAKGRHCNAVANNIAQYVKSKGGDVVATGDWHPENHISFATQHKGKQAFGNYEDAQGKQQTIWPVHCVQNTDGAKFSSEIEADNITFTVPKGVNRQEEAYSAITSVLGNQSSPLPGLIKQGKYSEIIVTGNALNVCAKSTAVDIAYKVKHISAVERILFLQRGAAPVTEADVAPAIEQMQAAGIEIIN